MRQCGAPTAVILLIATVLFGAGCGAPPDPGSVTDQGAAGDAESMFSHYASLREPQRTEELVASAQAEGELTVYGPDNIGAMAEAFGEKYGIKINFFEGDPESLTSRLTQEADAGKHTADFFAGGSSYLMALDSNSLLGEYESALRESVPVEARGENWTGNRRHPFIAAYNTDLVSPEEIPDDFLDFADPKWNGRISMELSDYEWYMNLVEYYEAQGMSRHDIDSTFAKIAANAKLIKGHSEQMKLLAAGQFAVVLAGFVHHVEGLAADGAPITWGGHGQPTVQPIVMRYEGVAVLRHAQHPAAATLFMDFVLGPEGIAMVEDNNQLPAVPTADDPLAGLSVVMADAEGYLADSATWAQDYDKVLRGAA